MEVIKIIKEKELLISIRLLWLGFYRIRRKLIVDWINKKLNRLQKLYKKLMKNMVEEARLFM
jgi:hypothetical protein